LNLLLNQIRPAPTPKPVSVNLPHTYVLVFLAQACPLILSVLEICGYSYKTVNLEVYVKTNHYEDSGFWGHGAASLGR